VEDRIIGIRGIPLTGTTPAVEGAIRILRSATQSRGIHRQNHHGALGDMTVTMVPARNHRQVAVAIAIRMPTRQDGAPPKIRRPIKMRIGETRMSGFKPLSRGCQAV
jgi:hypothetical protein